MNDVRARIGDTTHKMLDVADAIVDQLASTRGVPQPSRAVARRQLANMLRLSRFCARSTCRRSGACRGEPSECLHYAAPLLAPQTFAGLLDAGRRKRRRRLRP